MRDGRVRPSRGALLLLRRMGTGGRKAKPWGGFTQHTHKDRARTRGAGAFAFRPELRTSPRSPGPLCGHQRPQGWRWLGTSQHSLSWGIPMIAGLRRERRDELDTQRELGAGGHPQGEPSQDRDHRCSQTSSPLSSSPGIRLLLSGSSCFHHRKGSLFRSPPLPPFPAIVMLKSPGHVSAKN